MLQFDETTTRILNTAYQGADFTRRRQASFDALRPLGGETILDIGCGNGMLTAELARAVGEGGRVIGIDSSAAMRAAGIERCRDFACADFVEGDATALPLEDGIADKAASVQVFEYIEDIETAAAEAMRCLRPGGRLVVSDLHLGSFIWYSDDPGRMDTLMKAWDAHFVAGDVPARLPGIIKAQGHEVESVVPVTLTDHTLKPDGIARTMMHLMRSYAVDTGAVAQEVADAWFDEQNALAEVGRFFFSITQFVVSARKAA